MNYDHHSIEKKWQKEWLRDRANEVIEDPKKKKDKMYVLDMFPYPSAQGLHVGHPEGYTATDIVSRYFRMRGKHVLHPMGWDAFGLPAENYAIKTKVHPHELTQKNIETFRRQIQSLGFSYDWSREVDTSDPAYYRWTQWLFLQLYKKGLAYKKKALVNWCPSCQTVLANEQVVDGECERCHTGVEQKELEQWFFRITDYVDRLLSDLHGLDWPERIKEMQRNWIGKKVGINITYHIERSKETIVCFTTRPDTNFGATFIVVGPEYPGLSEITTKEYTGAVEHYVRAVKNKSEKDRIAEGRKKTGVFTGRYAINNLNGKKLPIWVGDFVLGNVGTGAVVAVPGHDLRDFEFAQAYELPIVRVVVGGDGDTSSITKPEQVQEEEGTMINSDFLNGLDIHVATEKVMDYLEEKGWGKRVTTYHLRDWLVSRQRYWGAPIPLIFCEHCKKSARKNVDLTQTNAENAGWIPVPEKDLPVELPTDVDFKPTGESPLARSKSFHNVACPTCGKKARRESDTMDTFVDSSWYFLRYCDPKNDTQFAIRDTLAYWCPVDLYVGGAEHAVMHLLYARFITKAFADFGHINFQEPFVQLRNQGMILGEDGQKMSKSRGNVINPDDVIAQYGADTMRLYEMFMGPFEDTKPWSTDGIKGVRRFLEKVYRLFQESKVQSLKSKVEIDRLLHKTIKKVTEDIEAFKFNTAISAMMIFVNETSNAGQMSNVKCQMFLKLLAPFAPHLAEELWEKLGHKNSIFQESWPTYDTTLIKEERVTLVIQVNGKVRDRIEVDAGIDRAEAERIARESVKIQPWLEEKEIARIVVVPGKLVNIVTQ